MLALRLADDDRAADEPGAPLGVKLLIEGVIEQARTLQPAAAHVRETAERANASAIAIAESLATLARLAEELAALARAVDKRILALEARAPLRGVR